MRKPVPAILVGMFFVFATPLAAQGRDFPGERGKYRQEAWKHEMERTRELLKAEHEYQKHLREMERERGKAEREYYKDLREMERERDKRMREQEREYRKMMRERDREYEKWMREGYRHNGPLAHRGPDVRGRVRGSVEIVW